LFWRTFDIRVGTKNATVSLLRFEDRFTVAAFEEMLARVGWHLRLLDETASRTGQVCDRDDLHFVRTLSRDGPSNPLSQFPPSRDLS
jgi:hypothetical protein